MTPRATVTANITTIRADATIRNGSSANGWHAETMCDDDALARLAAEWDDLYERCSAATAFVSFPWLDSWWRSYGKSGRLMVVTARHGGRLMAAAAFMRCYRWGLPVLRPVGAGISDLSDVLIDDRCAADAARCLAGELARCSGHVVDLPEVPDKAAVWQVARAWPHRSWRLRGSTCLEIPARPVEEVIAALPRRVARKRRVKTRRIEEARITARTVDGQGAANVVATLLTLHREQWRARGMNPEHGRPRFAAHLQRAVPALMGRDQAALIEYAHEEKPVAVQLLLGGNRMMGAYLYGFQPELRLRIDVAQLLLGMPLDIARQRGASMLSLLRGDEPHKREWLPRETHNERLLLACLGAVPATLYASGLRSRNQLADFVKARLPRIATAARTVRRWCPFFT
jgi:CelD/BcsL family acetyltransferase involved in cellulose biosynthesis